MAFDRNEIPLPRALRRALTDGARGLSVLVALVIVLVPLSAHGGAFSGDNGKITYTCGTNICTIDPDGSNKALSSFAGSDPSWSQDGKLAYVTASGIVISAPDGSGSFAVPTGAAATQPTWSPDSGRIGYAQSNDIHVIPANTGGGAQNLTNSAALDADPAFSPDGSKIAFASDNGSGYDIWTVQVSNPAILVPVTTSAGDERSPTWSPSGSTIVYTSSTNGHLIAVSSAGGGTPWDLNVQGTDPTFSPDGTKIAFIDSSGYLASITASVVASPTVTTIDGSGAFAQPDWQSVPAPPPPPGANNGPPRNAGYPAIHLASGDSAPAVDHLLTTSVGTWNGSFPITYKYQWKRCEESDPVNGPCVEIRGATTSFYTPVADDYGKRLRVAVNATNTQGSATQNSEVSMVVTATPTRDTATPQIAPGGTNTVDQTLFLTGGAWTGAMPITFTYSWRRCNPVGDLATCVQIPGATSATYVPTHGDIGYSIRVWITGTNVAGSDIVITNHTFPIVDKAHFAPRVVTPPEIAGTVGPGRELTANVGAFNGDGPPATTVSWLRCDATGDACHVIPSAKKTVYLETLADVGYTLRLSVTARNSYGKEVAQSPPTEPVAGVPPHVRGRIIVGTAKGEYLAGGGHDDVILGLAGNDTVAGGAGSDRIHGGPGNDIVTGGSGDDRLYGGPGSDTIYAADGERDTLDCGPGRDRAIVDPFDHVTGCEVVDKGAATANRP